MEEKKDGVNFSVGTSSLLTVESSEMISILRNRISDLEYQNAIKDIQIRNLLSVIECKGK